MCAGFKFYSERRHTAHEQQAEARISYRFHPRFGETVRVRRRLKRGGAAFLVVHQLDGTFACLPAWMTDEAASGLEVGVEPRFPLDVLRSLRNEVDALLGFLASESKTERPDNDAPIRESPAKLLSSIDEAVLAPPALMIVRELVRCRLPDVDAGAAGEMLRRDLGHRRSPRLPPLPAPSRSRAAAPR